jgi:hypothetical protein
VRPTEVNRILKEGERRARTIAHSPGSQVGPAKSEPHHAGTMDSGEWVPYGRVGITLIGDGFRVRG